jgi:hypothetical protein
MKPRFYKMGLILRILTFNWATAITLAPFGIFIKEKYFDIPYIANEEAIHWYQQVEMWFIGFYLWYIIEWVIKALTPPIGAYKALGFEREAKRHRFDYLYTLTRKHWAWTKYIKE